MLPQEPVRPMDALSQPGVNMANAGAQAGRIGAQPTAYRPGQTAPAQETTQGPQGWAAMAPLRQTYRLGGGGRTQGSFMALPVEQAPTTSGLNAATGGPNTVQTAQVAPTNTQVQLAPSGPTYVSRQEAQGPGGKFEVVGTWTDEEGTTHVTVRGKDGNIYADTGQGYRQLSQSELNAQAGSQIELTSQTASTTDSDVAGITDEEIADLDRRADEAEARGDTALAQAFRDRADAGRRVRRSATATSGAGLTANTGAPPPASGATQGGSNAALASGQSQGATTPQDPNAQAQARQEWWTNNGRGAGLPGGWRGNGAGVWDDDGRFMTWEQLAAGQIPKTGDSDRDLTWANLQAFGQRMLGETTPQTDPRAGVDAMFNTPIPETPRMSQEERDRLIGNERDALRMGAANRARALMQAGGFANAESQAGVFAEQGALTDANIASATSAKEMAFALDDLSARRQDVQNQLARLNMQIMFEVDDYKRQQLIAQQKELMQYSSGIEATMAAYQRELSKPSFGEMMASIGGGLLGGGLTALTGGIGGGLGAGLGSMLGSAVGGDSFMKLYGGNR
jgi:hypothetical protein